MKNMCVILVCISWCFFSWSELLFVSVLSKSCLFSFCSGVYEVHSSIYMYGGRANIFVTLIHIHTRDSALKITSSRAA